MACGTADCLVWEVLKYSNCSFRAKTETKNFCRSPDNVTGLCEEKACPLANSNYATTRLKSGKIILQVKTPERAHMPAKMWDKIELPEDVTEANKIIDGELQYYYDPWLIEKVKFRYEKLLETLHRQREMRAAPKVLNIPVKPKQEKRLNAREVRALHVANIEATVKKQLLKNLEDNQYEGLYNLENDEFEKTLDEVEEEVDYVDDSEWEEMTREEEEEVLEKA